MYMDKNLEDKYSELFGGKHSLNYRM